MYSAEDWLQQYLSNCLEFNGFCKPHKFLYFVFGTLIYKTEFSSCMYIQYLKKGHQQTSQCQRSIIRFG